MHAMYIMDIAILCAVASYAARLQIIVNPPYMGSGGMGERLAKYVKDMFLLALEDSVMLMSDMSASVRFGRKAAHRV